MTIAALAAYHRVIAPDLVGFGYSERPPNIEYSLRTWVEHTVGLLDALGLACCDVIGSSFGGALALALALAIRHPARVRRMVLTGSLGGVFEITPGLDAVWGYRPSPENMRRLLNMFVHDRTLVTDELARRRYQASVRPDLQESFAAMFPAPRQRWVEALASDEQALRALGNETLIVHGREDRVVPVTEAYKLFDLIPCAQLHLFGHCGHWTHIEHAARFDRLVIDFLRGP